MSRPAAACINRRAAACFPTDENVKIKSCLFIKNASFKKNKKNTHTVKTLIYSIN